MKKLLILLLLTASLGAGAQNVVVYWYGTDSVVNASATYYYLIEIIV